MNIKIFFALLLALALVLSMTACGAAPGGESAAPSTTAPAETEPVALSRIVVYNSSLCTVLEAFGKADTIVGAYGSLAEKYGVPSCGGWNEVDVEAVIATGAQAIFGYAKYTTDEQKQQLNEAGIECYFIELSDAAAAADEVAQLGEIFGCRDKAQAFVDLYNKYDTLLTGRLAGVEKLTVYVEGISSTPKTANNTSAAHKLVESAGLVNLYAGNETQYPERNLEDVIAKNPDVIVKLCGSSATLDENTYDAYIAELSGVAAADEGKVILLNNECGTTAIGSIIGRLYVAKFAYPDAFADVDVDAVYAELYTAFLGGELSGSGAYFK